MSQNDQKYPQMTKKPQNTAKYVLQDYRGVGGRAHLPTKLISLPIPPYFRIPPNLELPLRPTFTVMAASLRITSWMSFPVKLLTIVSLDLEKSQVINYDVATQHTMLVRIIKSI